MNNKLLADISLALLVYLPTCAFVPFWVYGLLLVVVLYTQREFLLEFFGGLLKKKVTDRPFALLVMMAFIAAIMRLVDFSAWEGIKDFYSYAYMFPFTYLVARQIKLNTDTLKYFIIFILIEIGFGTIQYVIGESSFFTSLPKYREMSSYELLYNTRVFGLSPNSSGLGLKVFVALILVGLVGWKTKTRIIIEIIILYGAIITFGRMTLMVIAVYYLVQLISYFVKKGDKNKWVLLPSILYFLFFAVSPNWTYNQFTRNQIAVSVNRIAQDSTTAQVIHDLQNVELIDTMQMTTGDNGEVSGSSGVFAGVDMAGRNEIWLYFMSYIKQNPIFGNMGKKFMIGRFHGHNSFLELLSSFGALFSLLLLGIFAMHMNKHNWLFVVVIGMVSMGQYFVLWGMSFFDAIFYYLLFFYKGKDEN